jgi:hypothetical protein
MKIEERRDDPVVFGPQVSTNNKTVLRLILAEIAVLFLADSGPERT